MVKHLKNIVNNNIDLIKQHGSSYSRHILYRDILYDIDQCLAAKEELKQDAQIIESYTKLLDLKTGINSLSTAPADYKIYGSYYWRLRFFADIGLGRDDLPFDQIIDKIFVYQLPDGQYTSDFHRKTKTPVAAICITAQLAYILATIGYQFHRSVQAAFAYILSTQRKDGGWHCDWKKQAGEIDQNAASCPVANLQVIRALSVFGDDYLSLITNAANSVYDFLENHQTHNLACDFGHIMISHKLRYPPHYHGMDILNILDTLSNCPQCCATPLFEKMIQTVIAKWDGNGFFKSEKTIPEWKNFNFGKNNRHSDWISCLICRMLTRVYCVK